MICFAVNEKQAADSLTSISLFKFGGRGPFDLERAVTWPLLERCCSKFGCKKTFDLHAGLAGIIHLWLAVAQNDGQGVAVYRATQT